MTAQEYFGEWWRFIPANELSTALLLLQSKYLGFDEKICPNSLKVFYAFKKCPFNNLRVVIVGQDPYPQKGVATGIAFGVDKGTQPSLEVLKESCIDYSVEHYGLYFDNSLVSWAEQGVLLLNSALTVEVGKPNSHTMIWRPFISKFLHNLSYDTMGIVYVLLGEQAQTLEPYIRKGSIIIKEKHPSYYARTNTKMPSVFKRIDKELIKMNGYSIEWFKELKNE